MSGLYFLKQLKRASLSSSQLLHFYTTVIRPVLEYASPLWHPTSTKSQTERLEAVQRRTINIIFCCSSSTPNFLHWHWLTFHLFKQDVWISLSVFWNILSTWQLFTSFSSTSSRPSRDIPAQEAYCIPKAKPSNWKILLKSVLHTCIFSVETNIVLISARLKIKGRCSKKA